MGVVFRAEDTKLKRIVALKAMLPNIAADHSAKERFLREAQATAAIEHDNIVTIYQVDEDRGVPFLAMQFLQGESLQDRLNREGKLDEREMLRIGREAASALAAAHDRGLIHRDIKPDNIWLEHSRGSLREPNVSFAEQTTTNPRVKIVDFGLVRTNDDVGLTQSGTILGTPRYMSPEQAHGKAVDHRSDLFSLGSVLYHLATGKPPFQGSNLTAMLIAVSQEDPQAIREANPDISPQLAELITRLLQKDREQRFDSASDVVEAITAIEALEIETGATNAEAGVVAESPTAVAGSPDPATSPTEGLRSPVAGRPAVDEVSRSGDLDTAAASFLPTINTSTVMRRTAKSSRVAKPSRTKAGPAFRNPAIMGGVAAAFLLVALGVVVITVKVGNGTLVIKAD